jgi:SAM-dependent methyltransferase
MPFYVDRHASLYDLFYQDKPYKAEAAFVAARLRDHGVRPGSRVLELACGTGRHAVELAGAGFRMTASDNSRDMLAVARSRPRPADAQLEFLEGDMRTVDGGGVTFDAALCLFDSIGYLQTNNAIVEAFRNTRRQLRPGGILVFEFWHAAAMLRCFEATRVRRWRLDGNEIVRISETSLDVPHQLAHVSYDITERDAGGGVRNFRETHTNRYFLVQEMAALLALGGLTPIGRWFSGYSTTETITVDTWHVIGVAERQDP